MWSCVDFVWTDVSEERIASIFRVEKSASEEPAWAAVACVGIILFQNLHFSTKPLFGKILRFPHRWLWRMPSSGKWRCVDLVSADVSEEPIPSIFRVERSAATCSSWFLASGFFYPQDGGDTFLRNFGSHKIYTAPHPRKLHTPQSLLWKARILLCCTVLYFYTGRSLIPKCIFVFHAQTGTGT
jgi:hypothetical protein